MSDDLRMGAIDQHDGLGAAAVLALAAGVDLLLIAEDRLPPHPALRLADPGRLAWETGDRPRLNGIRTRVSVTATFSLDPVGGYTALSRQEAAATALRRRRNSPLPSLTRTAMLKPQNKKGPQEWSLLRRADPWFTPPGGKRRPLHGLRCARPVDVNTTQIYTHVLNRGPAAVRSPAARMFLP